MQVASHECVPPVILQKKLFLQARILSLLKQLTAFVSVQVIVASVFKLVTLNFFPRVGRTNLKKPLRDCGTKVSAFVREDVVTFEQEFKSQFFQVNVNCVLLEASMVFRSAIMFRDGKVTPASVLVFCKSEKLLSN